MQDEKDENEDAGDRNEQGQDERLAVPRNVSPVGPASLAPNKLQSATTRNDKASPDPHRIHGMTLEDDVESMLSDQLANSSEQSSYFRVRLHSSNVGQIGGGLAAGDSTFRCNESAQDDDRGLISESEDGWVAEKDPRKPENRDDDFEGISEHSSDDRTDSSGVLEDPQGVVMLKKKKKKDKGEGAKKKKKKKAVADDALPDRKDEKLVDKYKKLEDLGGTTKKKKAGDDAKNNTASKKPEPVKQAKMEKKEIKVNISVADK
jgi:hypothetical protein